MLPGKMKKIHFNFKMLICLGALAGFSGCASQSVPSASDATQPSSNLPAAIRVSSDRADAAEPSMAFDERGNIYVVYVEHGDDRSGDVFLQKYAGELRPLGEKVRVNSQPGEATAWRGDQPTVSVLGRENVYIGWNARTDTSKEAGNDLMLSVSIDGGKTFAAPVKVNDDRAPASHGMHGMVVNGNGVYFVWLDERYLRNNREAKMSWAYSAAKHEHLEPNAELYFAVSKDGGKTFSANKRIARNICPCCKVSLLAARDGEFYFSWRHVLPGDMRHMAVASSADGGKAFSETTIVSDDKWQINACPVSGAPLVIGRDGALGTAWYTSGSAGPPGLYWAESTDRGKTFSPRKLLSEGMVFGTPVMLFDDKSGYRLVWMAKGRIFTQAVTE